MPSYIPPRVLRGFVQHGVVFDSDAGDDNAMGTCPFCKKELHFFANLTNRLWDCKSCGRSGDFPQFLAEINKRNKSQLDQKVTVALAKNRGLSIATLIRWELGWDGTQYTIPVYWNGQLTDLRRYAIGAKSILGTSGCKTGPLGAEALQGAQRQPVWLCEGEWDAMALGEVMTTLQRRDVVLGIPGANTCLLYTSPSPRD